MHTPAEVDFLPGIFELARKAHRLHYLVIVITNQSGIGRGYYTEEAFHRLMNWMKSRFLDVGATIDAVYFCAEPPGTSSPGKKSRNCRKPNPFMLLSAQTDFQIDLSESVLVGDQWSDIEAGVRAGVGRLFQIRGRQLHPNAIPIDGLGGINLESTP